MNRDDLVFEAKDVLRHLNQFIEKIRYRIFVHHRNTTRCVFLAFACNQKKYFGMRPLKEWVDSKKCVKYHHNDHDLNVYERKDTDKEVLQSSGGLLSRDWQEVRKLFLCYLKESFKTLPKCAIHVCKR